MKKKQLSNIPDLIAEKDKKIADLTALLHNNIKCHQRVLQEKISYYENILALMPGSVYWLDRNNVYMGCNDIQASQVMLSSRHDIVGKKTADLLSSLEQAIEVDKLNNKVMETGIAHSDIERGMFPDGERVYFSQKVPLRDKQDEIIGLLGISLDITELKKTEAALIIAKEHAEAANRVKTEFIANMSHDIRTPLSGVIGMSNLLLERLTQPENKQFVHWINQSGHQLLNLLNSILDVVSAENMNDTDIREETFDLRQCLDDIIQLERPTTFLKGISLTVNVHRILLNLLGNAIKFTQTGSIVIDVKLIDIEDVSSGLQFYVIDTGIGISIEQQPKVFERFFRASSSYDGVYSGYGVGLHIAQSYVKILGGKLNFISQPGVGSTFYFDLPAKAATMAPTSDTKNKMDMENSPSGLNNRYNACHFLLVEDNPIALRMLELIVAQVGCNYSSAASGEEACQLLELTDFDLIITDIGLPQMSGYELTRHIRAREATLIKPATPIIGLSAHAYAKKECLESGMNDAFCKPLNSHVMKSILSQYIDGASTDCILTPRRHELPEFDAQLFELDQFPVLDIDHAANCIGNKPLLDEMLYLMATQEIPIDMARLHDAYTTGDWEIIEKIAHKMKGGAVYCGTFKMQYACQYLERYKKAGYTKLLDPLYHQLIKVLEETKYTITNQT